MILLRRSGASWLQREENVVFLVHSDEAAVLLLRESLVAVKTQESSPSQKSVSVPVLCELTVETGLFHPCISIMLISKPSGQISVTQRVNDWQSIHHAFVVVLKYAHNIFFHTLPFKRWKLIVLPLC